MTDRLWFAIAAMTAVTMIAFAAVWPQGFGARSPGPFGHPPIVPPSAAATKAVRKLDLDAMSAAQPSAAPASASPAPAGLRPTE